MKLVKNLVSVACLAALSFNTVTMTAQGSEPAKSLVISKTVKKSLDAYFAELAKKQKFIGSVGLYQNGKLLYQYALTMKNNSVLTSNKTLKYRIGSISKTFTAVMIMQLIEEGKLKLDSKLSAFYPTIKNSDVITIAQILNHHSGIRSYTDDPKIFKNHLKPQSFETILAMIVSYDEEFKPGSRGKYSNSNFYLLGHIIEELTGTSYQDNLKSRITNKLGLNNTYYGGDISTDNNEVHSYALNDDKWIISTESDMSIPHGAGAIVSSTADLNIFINGLFNGKLISESSLASMTEIEDGFGKGIFDRNMTGIVGFGHGGAINNFRSMLNYQPATKVSLALLTNGLDIDQGKIIKTVLKASRGQKIKLPNFRTIKLTAEQLKGLPGEYKSDTHKLDVTLTIEGDQLMAQATGQGMFPLQAVSVNEFEFRSAGIKVKFDDKKAQFVLRQRGKVDVFVRKGDVNMVLVEVAETVLNTYEGVYKSPTFPMDITIFNKQGTLMAQATGQDAFPLVATTQTTFKSVRAGIVIAFDTTKNQLTITQRGQSNVLTK